MKPYCKVLPLVIFLHILLIFKYIYFILFQVTFYMILVLTDKENRGLNISQNISFCIPI